MKSFSPAQIRNVALVGHGGAGKTSLAEALLFCAGAINRQGRVEDGTTTTDFDPEEVKRGISLALSLAPFEFDGHKINLLDAPGYADFVTDLQTALDVADLAVIVVERGGGRRGPDRGRLAAGRRAGPAPDVLRQQARPGAGQLRPHPRPAPRARSAPAWPPSSCPSARRPAFRGIADLLTDSAVFYEGGKATKGEIPDEMTEREHEVRDNLVEGIVVADDDLTERYLEGEDHQPRRAGEGPGPGRGRGQRLPRHLRVGHQADRHRPPGPAHLRGGPVAPRPPAGDGARRATAPPRSPPTRPASPSPSSTAPSPTPTWARCRSSRCCRAPSGPTSCSPTPAPTPTSASTACSPCGARSRSRCSTCRPATWGRWPSCPTRPPATPWRPRARPSPCPPPEAPVAGAVGRHPAPSPRATRTSS